MSNCLMCGRPLKNKISIQRGYGSSCYKKIKEETKKDYKTKDEIEEIEGQVNFVDEIRKCS